MNRQLGDAKTESSEARVQENIAKWQTEDNSLAPLTEEQLDVIYELSDFITANYKNPKSSIENEADIVSNEKEIEIKPSKIILTMKDYIEWMVEAERNVKHENLKHYQKFYEILSEYRKECGNLFDQSEFALNSLNELKNEYNSVTEKTNYLHNLSEQVMATQKILKQKKYELNNKLRHFTNFDECQEKIQRLNNKLNSPECVEILTKIDDSVNYLNLHLQYKESLVYKMKYESLLLSILNKIYDFVNNILIETTKQVVDPELKTTLLPQNTTDSIDSAFSLYYGKFQSASIKVKYILNYLEENRDKNQHYKNIIDDCQKTYLTQRFPILNVAVAKALNELREKRKVDYSILFRSCSLFMLKVCQDEAMCYNYFFNKITEQFNDYLGKLCQQLYDILRPSLITINHIEVLSELCGVLKTEMLNEKIIDSEEMFKYVETMRQLLQDVEERLVFRTNVFFQHDLLGYKPSPGDLAYPEKLEHMENIAMELNEKRSDSRDSIVSLESQEVAHINAAQMAHFRSYTGNSPADLHGMWYPTVKRTLVCLSRLYFCLDKTTFQGLAQEALVICIKTVQKASDLISTTKSPTDGHLFQIKHLLIIREQIAPFQVDFTAKEMSLDFSTVHKAAIELINHRNHIFTFGSNNALLEFLLEGTPKVREYLVDSRKEIDKQLKHSCESFIAHATQMLIGKMLVWMEKAEHILRIIQVENSPTQELTVATQDFAKAKTVADIIRNVQKHMKLKIPEIQRSMQLYLANRETEFILFRPIKNNVLNAFMQLDQILMKSGYSDEDLLLIACPSPEQINVLICSVSLTVAQDAKNVN